MKTSMPPQPLLILGISKVTGYDVLFGHLALKLPPE
jgi:hypothetical protein